MELLTVLNECQDEQQRLSTMEGFLRSAHEHAPYATVHNPQPTNP